MQNKPAAIFFDKDDYQLLQIVNDVLQRGGQSQTLRSLLDEHMHPHGIKEMAASRGLRMAYAIASLLGSFEKGSTSDRIKALRCLKDEVFLSSITFYQKNTARVLLQIMKELVRSRGNDLRQLKLAHDFRMVSTGNPRKVRAELAKYHLLEMPEEWNQFSFDDHVHDANTKGRKSPTHLIMDAWIKGIRYLSVVYYNYVQPDVVHELIEASTILDVRVQVGIEMSCRFRDKYVRFTWEPHGFSNNSAFLKFLQEQSTIELQQEAREVSHYQQQYVFDVLNAFNTHHREHLNRTFKIKLPPLDRDDFVVFVGVGQPSLLHLARFIHASLSNQVLHSLEKVPSENTARSEVEAHLRSTSVESIITDFLQPKRNPQLHDPTLPQEQSDVPALLTLSPQLLLKRLLSLHSSSRFTLNLSNLSVQDTLEILYDCEGVITHVESYNLKNASHGMTSGATPGHADIKGDVVDLKSPDQHYGLINDLQKALNDDNVIILKRVIRAIIGDHDEQYLRLKKHLEILPPGKSGIESLNAELRKMTARKQDLLDILYNLATFHNYYKKRTLGSRVGSGSTGQIEEQHGMGLIILDTLPLRARKVVEKAFPKKGRLRIPVSAFLTRNTHRRFHSTRPDSQKAGPFNLFRFFRRTLSVEWSDWSLDGFVVHPHKVGNIATLGRLSRASDKKLPSPEKRQDEKIGNRWKYLNTNLKNSLKVLLGFIPAFLTFALTKDWWLLAYFGALIWFGITGSRNIIQSVLGGGGLRRSPLLPWNSLISWSRIADSLLYTGFSVPLLDYLVKTVLLDRGFDVTTASSPILLYSIMGLANGIYISSHNMLRGLPKGAVYGNFFRSILAIPIAIVLNSFISAILHMAGVPDVTGILQKWAAIISKFASDCVAAAIEGLADRQTNIKARLSEYRSKIAQLFGLFARLDVQFPEEDVLDMLQSPKMLMQTLNYEARDQEKLIIVNALDLMYFWMYQPRARKALKILLRTMSQEEWLIFYRSQLVLKRHKEVSQAVVDGLVGKKFSRALAFYLDRSEEYLADMEKLGTTYFTGKKHLP